MNAIGDERDTDAESELRRCLRDVLSLLALPASWRGLAPEAILVKFSEALEASVEIDVLVAGLRATDKSGDLVRVHGSNAPARAAEAAEWFSSLRARNASLTARVACGELGELTAVHEPLGYHASVGFIIVASGRPGFPSENELALIRASAAVATTAVETARAMREREQALRAKDDFLAVLGHELRNPLAPITTALEIIRHRSAGQLSREVQLIDRQVEHLSRLVDDLLDVARIERGGIDLSRSRVELATIIEQATEATETLIRQRTHTLRIDVPTTGLQLYVDRFRMQQVIVNLLINAARYTPEGGQIELAARAREGTVRISVKDNGIGMTPDLLQRIFDPFVQGRRPTEHQYAGLGVGLALVRTLVKLHGGDVSASSQGLGLGSEIHIDLPLAPTPYVSVPPPAQSSARFQSVTPRRIVIVDDNADAGELLGMAFTLAGHDVKVLNDPYDATELAIAFNAEAIVLDIGMPGLDGYGVAAELRQRLGDRTPPLVALTGYGQPDEVRKTKAAGFAAHCVKPVAVTEILGTIDALCGAWLNART